MKRDNASLASKYRRSYISDAAPGLFFGIGLVVSVAVLVLGDPTYRLILVCMVTVGIGALVLSIELKLRSASAYNDLIAAPLVIARHPEMLEAFRSISASLQDLPANLDPIHYDLAVERIGQLDGELSQIAQGHIVFAGTET